MIGALGAKDILIQLKGDNKDFKGAMKGADKSMGSFTDSVKAYGPAMALSFATGAAGLVAMSVKMAAAEQVVNRQTESMLKSQGIMWGEVKGEVSDYLNELEALTAYGDTDLQMAFNRMSSSGLEYKEVMESMKMVTDIAYTRNIDLVAAADLVSKAYNGQGSALKRYGIILEDGLIGLEALNAMQIEVNSNFADAADRTETLEGKMSRLNEISDDFFEGLGNELIPAVTDLADEFVGAAGGAEDLGIGIGKIIKEIPQMPGAIGWQLDLAESLDMVWEINKAYHSGVDTEKEMLDYLGLHNEELAEMSDKEFKHAKKMLELAGYEEKSKKLAEERAYAIAEQNANMENQLLIAKILLDVEERITKEGEKQLSMRERAAAKRTDIQIGRTTGTSLTGLGDPGSSRKSGDWTVTPSKVAQAAAVAHNWMGSNKSGAP